MKYNHYFFIMVYLLIAATFSYAMEKENKWHITQEITAIKKPWRARYLDENRIVVSNRYGSNVSIVNLRTNEVQTINVNNIHPLSEMICLQVDNKKIIHSHHQTIAVYDAQTGKKEWSVVEEKPIRSFACDTSKNTVYVGFGEAKNGIIKHNYITNDSEDIHVPKFCQIMSMHPTKEVMCISDYGSSGISLHSLPNLETKKDIFSLATIFICQYSPDGSCIVTGNCRYLFIIDPDKNNKTHPFLTAANDESFKNIAFHPNGLVLATLSQRQITKEDLSARFFSQYHVYKNQIVRFWDLKTQKCIYTMPVFNAQDGYDLTFSEDGSEMIIVLEDTCVRALVPFEAQKKCAYFLWLLHQIAKENNLPKDAVHHCSKMLWQTIKF
jgi:WD40 repeat protein